MLPAPLLLSTSVFGNVAAGLRFRGVAAAETRERVEHWLERLAIAHLRDRPASQLSSGEAQRTSLARALVLDPQLLLLDEPFVALDSATRAQLLDDFERLRGRGPTTLVLVTHHLHEAVRLGDRLAVLLDGRIRQCDVPERVMASPVDADVAALVGTDTRIPGTVVASRDGLATVEVGEHRIQAVSSLERGGRVLCCLRPEDVTIWADPVPAATGPRPSSAPATICPARVGAPRPGRSAHPGDRRLRGPGGPSITRASATEMRLAEGRAVIATFKATAVHLIPLAT